MAYAFLPDEQLVLVPSPDGEGGQVIEFALGFDIEADAVIVMAVMLTATDRPDALELHFGIRQRVGNGPATPPDYGKEAVDNFIPKHGRAHVVDLIRRCVDKVVRTGLPQYILMETFYPHLPAKALEKYRPVCETVLACGYKIEDEWREANGIDYWVFRRNDAHPR